GAGPDVRAARLVVADRGEERPRLPDRLPRRRRRVRRHVRGGAAGGVPRLLRRPALPARDAQGARMARVMLRFAPWISLLALAAAWEIFARSGAVTPFMLPRLSVVLERIGGDAASGELWQNLGMTLYRSLLGFSISALLGIGLGFAVTQNRLARWL